MVAALKEHAAAAPSVPPLALLRDLPQDTRSARLESFRQDAKGFMEVFEKDFHQVVAEKGDIERMLRDITLQERLRADQYKETGKDLAKLRSLVRDIERHRLSGGVTQDEITKNRVFLDTAVEFHEIEESVVQFFRDIRQQLVALRKQRLEQYGLEWEGYLSTLERDDKLAGLAPQVRSIWSWISKKLWAPEGTPTEDGFLMIWDRGDHHLQIEVFRAGYYDWFYRNRSREDRWFEEEVPFGSYSQDLNARINLLRKG